jgi:hypothetical protein
VLNTVRVVLSKDLQPSVLKLIDRSLKLVVKFPEFGQLLVAPVSRSSHFT